MASVNDTTPAPAAEPQVEPTMNTNLTPDTTSSDKKDPPPCTCDASMPRLARQTSVDSLISLDYNPRPVRGPHIPNTRRYSPIGRRAPLLPNPWILFERSTCFLDCVNTFDGSVELPRPSRGFIYLTTFPFTQRDVKKHAWLFSLKIEDTFMEETNGTQGGRDVDFGDGAGLLVYPTARHAREASYYDSTTVDVPSVYLSRALDVEVVPEDTPDVHYLIVTENRHRPAGSKLLVAESRKAAGIMMYYEAMKGDSVVFLGAVVRWGEKRVHPGKFRRVGSLEEGRSVREEGFVGVIC